MVHAISFMVSLKCAYPEMVAKVTVFCNRLGNIFMELAGIAYARGAPITHYTKPLFIQVLRETTASIAEAHHCKSRHHMDCIGN